MSQEKPICTITHYWRNVITGERGKHVDKYDLSIFASDVYPWGRVLLLFLDGLYKVWSGVQDAKDFNYGDEEEGRCD